MYAARPVVPSEGSVARRIEGTTVADPVTLGERIDVPGRTEASEGRSNELKNLVQINKKERKNSVTWSVPDGGRNSKSPPPH